MSYTISNTTGRLYDENLVEIIQDTNNPIYNAYVEDVKNGTKVNYVDFPTQNDLAEYQLSLVPKKITRLQLRLQMIEAGISDADVLAIIDTISDATTKAKIIEKWQNATTFDRMDSDLINLWLAMGKTESELNDFFTNASQL